MKNCICEFQVDGNFFQKWREKREISDCLGLKLAETLANLEPTEQERR